MILVLGHLSGHGGTEAQVTLLACELRRRGYPVRVLLRCPPSRPNQYREQLATAGVPLLYPPSLRWGDRVELDWCGVASLLVTLLAAPVSPLVAVAARRSPRRVLSRLYLEMRERLLDLGFLLALVGGRLLYRPRLLHVWRGDAHRAVAWGRTLGLPVVYSEPMTPNQGYRRIVKNVARATAITAVAQAGAVEIRRWLGSERPVTVVPSMAADPAAAEVDREGGADPVVGTVGRLAAEKGLEWLVQAIPPLREEFPRVRVIVVGDGERRAALQDLAARLGIDSNLTLLPALVGADLDRLLASLDVFVLPSLNEGLPTAILEAMAQAKPVVATTVGGIPEAVQHGRSGLLVPPRDAEALAAAILTLLRDRRLRTAMGAAGRALYEASYSVSRVVDQYEQVYAQALGQAQVPHGAIPPAGGHSSP